jgi:hypothetical protein
VSFSTPTAAPRRALVVAAAGAIGALSWLVAARALPPSWSDVPLYKGYADAVFGGAVPYRDVMIEYPPGALLALLGPRLFGTDAYVLVFTFAMALCGLVVVACADVLAERLGLSARRRYVTLGLLAASPLLLGTIVLERYDLFPAALVAGALVAQAHRRWGLGGALLGLGAAAKVYPAVLLPILLLFSYRAGGRRPAVRSAAAFAAAVLAATLPLLAVAGLEPLRPLLLQVERPLHIESTGAAVLHVAHQVGDLELQLENSYGSHNLVGSEARTAEVLTSLAGVCAVLLVALLYARAPPTNGLFVLGCAAMLLALAATGKVLSPQFLVWLLPAALLVPGSGGVALALLMLVTAVLTHVLYPGMYTALLSFEATPSWTLVARDAVLVAAASTAVVVLQRRVGFGVRESVARAATATRLATTAIAAAFVGAVVLLASRRPPFLEESTTAWWTEIVAGDPAFRFAPLSAGREPLFEWVAAVLSTLGLSPFSAGRAVSALAGAALVLLAAQLGRSLGGARAGALAAAAVAVSPFVLVYASVGVVETLATALALAALVLQEALARTIRLIAGAALGLVLGAAFLTAGPASALLLVLWPLSLLRFDWTGERRAARLLRLAAYAALALLTALSIRSVLQFSERWDDFVAARERPFAAPGFGEWLRDPFGRVGENAGPFVEVLVGYLTLPLLAASFAGLVVGLRRRSTLALLVGLWALVPWGAAVLLAGTPLPGYVHLPALALLVLAGAGIAAGVESLRAGRGVWAAALLVALVLLAPALRSATIVAAPAEARYPGVDDVRFVTGSAAGTGWAEIRDELLVRAPPGPQVVLRGANHNPWLEFSLRDDARFRFVDPVEPDAARALFTVANGEPPPAREGGLAWRQAAEALRPRGGTPLVLYESGVELDGVFLPDPEALRAAIGGGDADYDAFLQTRPEIREWADAQYVSRG